MTSEYRTLSDDEKDDLLHAFLWIRGMTRDSLEFIQELRREYQSPASSAEIALSVWAQLEAYQRLFGGSVGCAHAEFLDSLARGDRKA